jgi:threonine dehydratase
MWSAERIREAAALVGPRLRRTPLEECPFLSRLLGVPALLKLEFLQLTGSFKLRGALLRLAEISPDERASGVATCSAGNHGWALAWAGRREGIPVTVYLPATADPSKRRGIEALGARVVEAPFPGFDLAERYAVARSREEGTVYVSAFDDPRVILGNGATLAWEVLEDAPDVATWVVPVGGGSLAAGLSVGLTALGREFRLVACQHAGSPSLKLSLERGEAVTEMPPLETAAGGVEGGIGRRTFSLIRDYVAEVALVTEAEILDALRWCLAEHRYLIEPSAAVPLAACLTGKTGEAPGPVAIILTGRNLSSDRLARILAG